MKTKTKTNEAPIELHIKYRPTNLSEVVGQSEAINVLEPMIAKNKIPHALLFQGPSGCGKTTLARIIADVLGCSGIDIQEINAAEDRGIDMVRKIQTTMNLSPMGSRARAYIIDECHRLTGDAQSAMLKILEDAPKRSYFMLATTDPKKLLPTVLSRLTEVRVKSVEDEDLYALIRKVMKKEKLDVSKKVLNRIVECAGGSAREAVKSLGRIAHIDSEKQQLNAVQPTGVDAAVGFLGAQLMFQKNVQWQDIARTLQRIEDNDIEGVRRGILTMATSCAIGGKDKKTGEYKDPPKNPMPKSLLVIEAFKEPFFDSGKAGLLAAVLEVLPRR